MTQARSVYDFLGYMLQEQPDLVGLDYESAVDAMPMLYGVSYGNGNDGVSHTYADFYVRTCEPYVLAAAAMLSRFNEGAGYVWAADTIKVEGEKEYAISATVYDPPADEQEESSDDDESWSSANGAWMICEVFPDDEPRSGRPVYDSLVDAFSAELIALARKI